MKTQTFLDEKEFLTETSKPHTEIRRLYRTSNYSIFSFLVGNRKKKDCLKNIRAIKKSILAFGWDKSSLLIVNKNKVLMDGQNRIWALQEIEQETGNTYEVWYDIDDNMTLADVIRKNNTSFQWKPINYIKSYADQGNKDYKFIADLIDQFKFPPSTIPIFLNQSYNNAMLREGKIKIEDKDKVLKYIMDIEKIKPYYEFYNTRHFISAMMFFLSKKEFSIDEFINKLKQNRNMLYRVTTVNDYKLVIQTLYNYHRQGKITFIQA
jgi:hypothetical protein